MTTKEKKMSKLSRYITFGVSASTLLLVGGCSNRAEEALTTTESIDTHKNELVTELNAISETEAELQPAFETTLAEDDELSTLSDGSSEVFTNIEARRESLQAVEEKATSLSEDHTALTEGENADLPEAELNALVESLEQTTSSLDEYTSHYASTLDTQTQFFESLAGEDASYETMSEGIESISSEDETTKQYLLDLDEQLSSLEESNNALMSSLNEIIESN